MKMMMKQVLLCGLTGYAAAGAVAAAPVIDVAPVVDTVDSSSTALQAASFAEAAPAASESEDRLTSSTALHEAPISPTEDPLPSVLPKPPSHDRSYDRDHRHHKKHHDDDSDDDSDSDDDDDRWELVEDACEEDAERYCRREVERENLVQMFDCAGRNFEFFKPHCQRAITTSYPALIACASEIAQACPMVGEDEGCSWGFCSHGDSDRKEDKGLRCIDANMDSFSEKCSAGINKEWKVASGKMRLSPEMKPMSMDVYRMMSWPKSHGKEWAIYAHGFFAALFWVCMFKLLRYCCCKKRTGGARGCSRRRGCCSSRSAPLMDESLAPIEMSEVGIAIPVSAPATPSSVSRYENIPVATPVNWHAQQTA